jgi:hypothetical protein
MISVVVTLNNLHQTLPLAHTQNTKKISNSQAKYYCNRKFNNMHIFKKMMLFSIFDNFLTTDGVVPHIWEGRIEIMAIEIKYFKMLEYFILGKKSYSKNMVGYSLHHLFL